MGRRSATVPHHVNGENALDRLLTAEAQLAERLDAARADAEQSLRTAREEAALAEDACAATISERCAQLAAEYETLLLTELAEIHSDAERVACRFAAVDDTRLDEYVELVLARLLDVGGSATPAAEATR